MGLSFFFLRAATCTAIYPWTHDLHAPSTFGYIPNIACEVFEKLKHTLLIPVMGDLFARIFEVSLPTPRFPCNIVQLTSNLQPPLKLLRTTLRTKTTPEKSCHLPVRKQALVTEGIMYKLTIIISYHCYQFLVIDSFQ